jgi:hypothetical protein
MITRYALFEGRVRDGQESAFREAMLTQVLPKWKAFPEALAVRIGFSEARDPGAPEIAMVLAISYPDVAAMERTLASPQREAAKQATESVLARCFEGRIHHHVTIAHEATLA